MSQSLFSLLLTLLLMPFSTHTHKSTFLLFCRCLIWPVWVPHPYRKLLCSHKTQSHGQTKGIKRSPVYNGFVKLICDLEKSTQLFFYCYLSSKAFLASFIRSPGTELWVETLWQRKCMINFLSGNPYIICNFVIKHFWVWDKSPSIWFFSRE